MKKLSFMGFFLPALALFSFFPHHPGSLPHRIMPAIRPIDGALLIGAPLRNVDGALPIGALMPKAAVMVKDVSGKNISLGEAKRENGLLVMFSCNTCPYVIRNQGRTKEVCGYAANRNIGVILLNANEGDRNGGNSFEEMQAYARDQGYSWYYALDGKSVLADAFGASRTPECYLFDKKGVLVYHGAIDDSPGDAATVKRHHLQAAIDEMIAGREVTVKETRSVGCSINRGL